MDKLTKHKATLRSQTIKWIRGLIQETEGGGVCQAELEIMSGLHMMHLTTILSSNVTTLLQGRKNQQEPASTPKSWRKGDQGILYLPRYLEGTLYRPEFTKIKQVIAIEEITWNEAGLPNDCTAVTETEKNINLLAKYFGTRGEARRIAREKTNTIFDSASTTSIEQVSDSMSNQSSGPRGKTLEYKGEMITFMDEDMPQCSSGRDPSGSTRPESSMTHVGKTRRVKNKRQQVNKPLSDSDDDDRMDDNPPRKKTTIVRGSPPAPIAPETDVESMLMDQLKDAIVRLRGQTEGQGVLGTNPDEINRISHGKGRSKARTPTEEVSNLDLLVPASFSKSDIESMQRESYLRDLDIISDIENLESQEEVISIQRAADSEIAIGDRPFQLYPASDTDSGAESLGEVGHEEYTQIGDTDIEDEHKGVIRYIRLGNQVTAFTKKTPEFVKVVADYFNAKLRALKIDISNLGGEQWIVDVREAEERIREYNFPRYCARCDTTTLLTMTPNCLCANYRPEEGSVYIRATPSMNMEIYRALLTDPKTLSFAMERVLTMMNTASYSRILEGFAIIGLDCEMWQIMTKGNNQDVRDTIDEEFERHYVTYHEKADARKFRSWPMVVETGLSMQRADGTLEEVMNERYRVPRKWTEPQLIHPAAHRIKDKAIAKIIVLIRASNIPQEEEELRDEYKHLLDCFYDLVRFTGGVSYTKYPHLVRAFKYLDEGPGSYQTSTWMKLLPEQERTEFVSLVRTKPATNAGGISAFSVSKRGRPCCFDARRRLNAKLLTLPAGTIIVYSGENDFDCLSCYPEGNHIILDITYLPALRYLIKHIAEWEVEGYDMSVHPEELFELRQVELMKLSKLWIALMRPSQEEIQRIEEGAHSAAVDAKMTREIFVIVMKFREKHSAIFDMMSPVDMDRTFYKVLMNAAFDRETRRTSWWSEAWCRSKATASSAAYKCSA